MNFSEALHLVVHENEKVTRAIWQTEGWARSAQASCDVGSKLWIMTLLPGMFGLSSSDDDYFSAFGGFGRRPVDNQPRLLRVTFGPLRQHSDPPSRFNRVAEWMPDMEDMLATDWMTAAAIP